MIESEHWAVMGGRGGFAEHEKHMFRVWSEWKQSYIDFTAERENFPAEIADALLELYGKCGASSGHIFVMTEAGWRNVQNPATGSSLIVNHNIAGERETAVGVFDWACNSVVMARDLIALSSAMAREALSDD